MEPMSDLLGHASTPGSASPKINQRQDAHECRFNIRRSCLSEISILSRPKKLNIIGFRQPTEWQYEQSRDLKPKQQQSQKKFYRLEQSQRNLDFLQALLGIFGLVLAMLNYEYGIFSYDVDGIDVEKYPDASRHPRVACFLTCVVRSVVLITTLISIGCLFKREQLRVQWINKYFNQIDKQHPSAVEFMHLDDEEDFLDEVDQEKAQVGDWSFVTCKFICEIALMAFVPLPNCDMYITLADSAPDSTEPKVYTYLLSEFMLAFMVLRIGFMFRAVMKFNIYN